VPNTETKDPEGRTVCLSDERWSHIINSEYGHPELEQLRGEVLGTVSSPDRRLSGRDPNEEWFYVAGVGPSRWLKVVVVYEAGRGRIITAFARRSIP
jgi:hypothetical protein